ncbi:DNA repair protein MutS, III [Venustampulla echinocandica]|uniref:DNA mismatch repair protein n=1 Tax=Venustampulla echinocandica TaxID=2656787 RepID=A0A370T8N4_9HELO|nr:DNA repair protein MutS, III [Venustampulla echinocandica]RDL29783.1 DNA repair protein MutS, III [Venustampulla echinocandica]
MAKSQDNSAATPARPPSTLKKQSSSSGPASGQRSIHSFFTKAPAASTPTPNSTAGGLRPNGTGNTANAMAKHKSSASVKKPTFNKLSVKNATPVPSSDAMGPPSSQENENGGIPDEVVGRNVMVMGSSPSRKAKKVVSYNEEDDDEDDDVFDPASISTQRRRARIPKALDDDDEEDVFSGGQDEAEDDDDDMDDFVVDDDSDAPAKPSKKRKRPTSTAPPRKRSNISPPPRYVDENEDDLEARPSSTAQQWKYDPDNTEPLQPRSTNIPKKPSPKLGKEKACKSEPEKRYPWLADLADIDRHPVGHHDYDPRTVYIPPNAWRNFSPFEKQYWEIKQKFWDTIVFFKKGKFYELYERDATIGHQLFDLKLTDRVNMRMVGVPEMSLDHWANQFVAKGFKIARVDQVESALGKEMREADGKNKNVGKPSKVDKIIRRELACVLTGGTLVEGSMLQDDMATFCVAIKEAIVDDLPAFGVAFVDTATGQFFLSEFVDDVDLTKFETFVAQTRPQELLLEKSCISTKVLRILKNSTSPTTIWNYFKPAKEFWTADITRRELDCSEYFTSGESGGAEVWPPTLEDARHKDLVMSAFGALTQYLRTLKLERDLLTQGNFTWYNPIQKGTTLVLDGQTLTNLEVFANSFDGGQEGTLFTLLNRCVTPFGKRMFRQWVCHPLADASRINERLDAVDMINADRSLSDQFVASMTRMPDLERLISRIHAGVCKAEDFVRVLDGFEQIEYTMGLLRAFGSGDGIVDRLINTMPDLAEPLEWWKTAFDRSKARDHKVLVPERGVEEDFDNSQDHVEELEAALESYLQKTRKLLGGAPSKIAYKHLGKEVYQLEVPASIKVPKDWQMMSSASGYKRYYNADLKKIIRQLQETQETHAQIVKLVAGRLYAKFDKHYDIWLQSIKIIAQLDCLVSLAAASAALGEPSCRPQFVEAERSVVEFEELRHPCMLPNVTDFIPNDVKLGGGAANINLLTGANAAGKSTILRMTCVAVIMAQIGCYVPCVSATLTPVDRIMSRLGANDNIFAAQSTFFVELSETKKILSEATPRSLVILDELGRGTSSYDGVAVAQAVLHHVASHIGCTGFFATHYHSLATEFSGHPEIAPKRMQIHVDEDNRCVTFLYKLENGVAEGSFGMHCAAMCGIPSKVIDRAEVAAKEWEHTSRLKESLEKARSGCYIPLGIQSDVSWMLKGAIGDEAEERGLDVLMKAIESL